MSAMSSGLADTARDIASGALATPEAAETAMNQRREAAQQKMASLLSPPSP